MGGQLLPLGGHRLGFVPSAPGGGDSKQDGAGRGGEAEKKDSTWARLCAAWSQPLLTQPVRKGLLVLLSQPQWRTGPQRAQRSCPRGQGKETMCVDRCSVLGTSLSSSSAGGYHSPHVTEEEMASERRHDSPKFTQPGAAQDQDWPQPFPWMPTPTVPCA